MQNAAGWSNDELSTSTGVYCWFHCNVSRICDELMLSVFSTFWCSP